MGVVVTTGAARRRASIGAGAVCCCAREGVAGAEEDDEFAFVGVNVEAGMVLESRSASQHSLKSTRLSPSRQVASRLSFVSEETVVEKREKRSILVMLDSWSVRCTLKEKMKTV